MRGHPSSRRSGKSTHILASLALICFVTLAALAIPDVSEKAAVDTTVAVRIAKRFHTVSDLDDLVARFRAEQETFNRITPPTLNFWMRQTSGVLLFDAKSFPAEMAAELIESEDHGFLVYRLIVAEDPKTREVVFANAEGKEVYASKPEPDFDPWSLLREYYPNLETGGYSTETIQLLKDCYDPARIQVAFTLLPAEYAEKYALALAAERADRLAQSGGGTVLMGYSGPPVTNLVFTAIESQTNGMLLTLAYPDGFTNRVDFFACTNLVGFWWDLAATTNVSASTNWIEWLDPSPPDLRFYAAGNADLDADADGLADAREKFMYHTSATTNDTDGDGLLDGGEVNTYQTNPLNPDTDGDGMSDGWEIAHQTDPTNNDRVAPSIELTVPPNQQAWSIQP